MSRRFQLGIVGGVPRTKSGGCVPSHDPGPKVHDGADCSHLQPDCRAFAAGSALDFIHLTDLPGGDGGRRPAWIGASISPTREGGATASRHCQRCRDRPDTFLPHPVNFMHGCSPSARGVL